MTSSIEEFKNKEKTDREELKKLIAESDNENIDWELVGCTILKNAGCNVDENGADISLQAVLGEREIQKNKDFLFESKEARQKRRKNISTIIQ